MKRLVIISACFLALVVLSGCFGQVDRPTDPPEAVPTSSAIPTVTLETPTPIPTPLPTPSPVVPSPSPTPLPPLFLDILSPPDGKIVRTEVLSVVGLTLPRVAIRVNSMLVRADEEGRFEANATLTRGQNIIAIVLTGAGGNQLRDFITVVYNPPPTPSPPPFFLVVDQPGNVTIVFDQPVKVAGRTSPQARITVNGVGVPVDDDGRFSTLVALTSGSNVIQVVALHPQGRTLRSTVSLIYDR